MDPVSGLEEQTRISVESAIKIAIELHKRGEIEEAITLYNDILAADPENPDAIHYLGVVKHQMGESEEAIELLTRSLDLVPGNVSAINNLGNVYREVGKLDRAEECYRDVLKIAPRHADTLINLAISLRGLNKKDDALTTIKEAIEANPTHPLAWHNLGNIYRDLKRLDDAFFAYQQSEQLDPKNDKSSMEIARILSLTGRREDAIKVLNRLIDREPDNVVAQHMLASISGDDIPDRASDAYVRKTFDDFAACFDESLSRHEYKAPRLVSDLIISHARDSKLDILDLGCGTGLCGALLRPVANRLVGVDLSGEMLIRAERRKVYDDLAESELTSYLHETDAEFGAIICVDTFVYFGKLDEAVAAAGERLLPGGIFVFTVERHEEEVSEEDYRLQHHGRYSHTQDYLSRTVAAAGLAVDQLEQIVPRMESGEPVSGTLVVARKQG
jgi:predicted TPR repeat methyltransferase